MNIIPFKKINAKINEKNLLEFHLEEWIFHYSWARLDITPEEFSSVYVARDSSNQPNTYFHSRYPKNINNQYHPFDAECLKLIDLKKQEVKNQKKQKKYDDQVIYRLLLEDQSYAESSMTPEGKRLIIRRNSQSLKTMPHYPL